MNLLNAIRRILIKLDPTLKPPKIYTIDVALETPAIYQLDLNSPSEQQYQVAYEGQLITDPLDFQTAIQIAVEENIDSFNQGFLPLAEVVIAPKSLN